MNIRHPVVGVWRVYAAGAPCPYHMFAFHADGAMQQSNPPAGNAATSDSVGLGLWEDEDGRVLASPVSTSTGSTSAPAWSASA